MANIKQADMK